VEYGGHSDGAPRWPPAVTADGSIPANRLFTSLKDGPYHVNGVQIFKKTVRSKRQRRRCVLDNRRYKRDNWDRGDIFGEEKIAVHRCAQANGQVHRY